jgi:hypothetical protein
MLEIRPNCEHCGKNLPNTSTEAMICSFECTYCKNCAITLFKNVCPTCGGNFESRPIRPAIMVRKYPVSKEKIIDPKDLSKAEKLITKYGNIPPEKR